MILLTVILRPYRNYPGTQCCQLHRLGFIPHEPQVTTRSSLRSLRPALMFSQRVHFAQNPLYYQPIIAMTDITAQAIISLEQQRRLGETSSIQTRPHYLCRGLQHMDSQHMNCPHHYHLLARVLGTEYSSLQYRSPCPLSHTFLLYARHSPRVAVREIDIVVVRSSTTCERGSGCNSC